jgi:hypothetical protein
MWTRPRTLLSLFDASGHWCAPFEAAGWNVVQVDLQHGDDIATWSASHLLATVLESFDTVDGLIAAPPCTDFAVSGAQYWPAKDADGRTEAAVHLVRQVLRCVDFLQPDFWALENPVGRLPRLVPALGSPLLAFDPWEYAGWSNPSAADLARLDSLRARGPAGTFTTDEIDLVRSVGAYTKRTLLWGSFRLPVRKPVPPVATSSQGSWLQSLGGKGAETKYLRSLTPTGFSLAFAAAQTGQAAAPTQMALDLAG